jgi:hypothetical protein
MASSQETTKARPLSIDSANRVNVALAEATDHAKMTSARLEG